MQREALNHLLNTVASQLSEAGCDYFLSATAKDDDAVLCSGLFIMDDVDAAASLIVQSINHGGAYGLGMLFLFKKVLTSLHDDSSGYELKNWSVLFDRQQEKTLKLFCR